MSSMLQKKGDKFTFVIEIKKLLLKKASSLDKDTALNACVERGKHLLTTNDKFATVTKEGDYVVFFNEQLPLEATLYKAQGGLYQNKTAKIMVRKKKKGFMVSGYQSIGSFEIILNEILEEALPYQKTFLLKDCGFPGSSLEVVIAVDDIGNFADDVSVQSASAVAAAARRPSELSIVQETNSTSNTSKSNGIASNGANPNTPSVVDLSSNKRSPSLSVASPTAAPAAAAPSSAVVSADSAGDPFNDFDPFSSAAVGTPGGVIDDWASSARQQQEGFDWPNSETNGLSLSPSPVKPSIGSRDRQTSLSSQNSSGTSSVPRLQPPKIPTTTASTSSSSSEVSELQKQLEFVKSVIVVQESKLSQASEFIAYQENQIKLLQQQQQPSALGQMSSEGSADGERVAQMEQVIVIQQSKLTQAEEFIEYQNGELQKLNQQVESLLSEGDKTQSLSDLQSKLTQAGEYIEYQDSQLAEAQSTIETLRASADVDVVELQNKLNQAADFISFQAAELETTQQQLADLQSKSSSQDDDKLRQAAEFIAFQEAKIDELQQQLQQAAAATSVGAGLVSPADFIADLQLKLTNSLQYVEHLKTELTASQSELDTTRDQLQVMIAYSNSTTPNITPTKSSNINPEGRPVSVPVDLLGAAAGEMVGKLKIILSLREQLESVSAELKAAQLQLKQHTAVGATATAAVAVDEDMAEMKVKLSQAADFIAFQQQQIDQLSHSHTPSEGNSSSGGESVAELSEKVSQAKEFIAYQSDQLDSLQKELTTVTELYADLQQLKAKEDHQVSLLRSELESVKAQLLTNSATAHDQVAADHAEMQVKLDQAKQFIEYQTEQIEALKVQLSSQPATSKSDAAAMAELQETLSSAEEFSAFQFSQLESLNAQLSGVNHQLLEANDKLVDQSNQIVDLTAALNEANLVVVKSQEDSVKLQQAADFIAYQGTQLEQLQNYLSTANEALAKHQDDAEKLKQAAEFISFQSKQIEELTALDTSEQQAVIASENDELNTKLQQAAEFVSFQTTQINELTEERDKLSAEVTASEEKLVQAKEYVEYVNGQLADLTKEVASLNDQLSGALEKASAHDELLTKVQQAADYIEYQTGEMAEKDETIEKLTSDVATLQAEAAEAADKLKKQSDKLKTSLALVESQAVEHATLREQVSQLEQYIAELEDRPAAASTAASVDPREVAALEAEVEELRAHIEERDGELAKLKDTLLKSSTAASSLSVSLETRLKESSLLIEQLKQQLRSKDSELKQLQQQQTDLTAKLQQAAEYINFQKDQLESASQTITTLQDSLEQLQSSSDAAADSAAITSQQQEKLQQAAEYINYQKEQLAQLSEDCEKSNAESEGLNAALLTAEQEVSSLKAQLSALKTSTSNNHSNESPKSVSRVEVEALTAQYDSLLADKEEELVALTGKIAAMTKIVNAHSNNSDTSNNASVATAVAAVDQLSKNTYASVVERLLLLMPAAAASTIRQRQSQYDLHKMSLQEASQQLVGLTDTVVGFFQEQQQQQKQQSSNGDKHSNGSAATAALAEKDAEMDKLLQSLIETKMQLALCSGDLDVERKATNQLRKQLAHHK